MKISTKRSGGELFVFLSGELDHHATRSAIPEISSLIDSELPLKLILDFEKVTFMDSSGIALVIGAYKRSKSTGSDFCVINTTKQAYKVFNAAGICKLMNIFEQSQTYEKI